LTLPAALTAPGAVVSSTFTSAPNTWPTSSGSVRPASRAARSLVAALTTALPPNNVAREPVVWAQPRAKVESTLGRKIEVGSPVTSEANCASTVKRPCPISV
jgi:hypothetical protein